MSHIMLNLAKNDVAGSIRMTGMAALVLDIKGKHLILNVDGDTPFERIQQCYWRTLAYVESFQVTSEDLGISFGEVDKCRK